jgi:hypothetical protein
MKPKIGCFDHVGRNFRDDTRERNGFIRYVGRLGRADMLGGKINLFNLPIGRCLPLARSPLRGD